MTMQDALLNFAKRGDIDGMRAALRAGATLFPWGSSQTVLHAAAACTNPNGPEAVRWLLQVRVPWNALNGAGQLPEHVAIVHGNFESATILREWGIKAAYALHYGPSGAELHQAIMADPYRLATISSYSSDAGNKTYCKSPIFFNDYTKEISLVADDTNETEIMMEYERPIMKETARLLLDGMPSQGLRVLNIGFGIGMIDSYFQDANPAEHVIIEGHRTVVKWMMSKDWHNRPGVRILKGRWQKILAGKMPNRRSSDSTNETPTNPIDIGKFDIVYFDTFAEGYQGHMAFIKHVTRLLRGPGSRFSFFHGHGQARELLNMMYTEVARLHLNDVGMSTEWSMVKVNEEAMRDNSYSHQKGREANPTYFIPICTLAPTIPQSVVRGVGWNSDQSTDSEDSDQSTDSEWRSDQKSNDPERNSDQNNDSE